MLSELIKYFVIIIFAIKLMLLATGMVVLWMEHTKDPNVTRFKKIFEEFEKAFYLGVTSLCIIVFNPFYPRLYDITKEMSLIFFIFGILTFHKTMKRFSNI
jgi:hypothetical protein